jgi:hypothetical protein
MQYGIEPEFGDMTVDADSVAIDLSKAKTQERDSEGRILSEGQQEFFKDSKVRDKDGNLLVVYHGTSADFTVFDIGRSGQNYDGNSQFGRGMYFAGGSNGAW